MPVSIVNMLAILKAVLKDILDYYIHQIENTLVLIQFLLAINMQDMY